jgi:non-specific serine/threonine protein kinase
MAADGRQDKAGSPNNGARQVLPVELSRFIGREQELTQLSSAVGNDRMVTILGPGGVGKTRVALQLARTLQAHGQSVHVVELAPLADGHLLVQQVATSLGIRDGTFKPLVESVCERLDQAESVLVLDNCEHLAHDCAELVETLLSTCAQLRILATSREALRVAGELVWPLTPLRLPAPESTGTSEVGQAEAVRLFVDRAQTRASTFKLTRHNAAVVARICQCLDGLPLAIELAAARSNVLAPEQIEVRLKDSLQLLVSARRTAAARQRTLSATFDWSYALLSEHEQRVFERLAVFAGPFQLEAAEAVCGAEPVGRAHVLDHLGELIDKSLVVSESDPDTGRYRLLQTVRRYAYERLLARQELEVTQRLQAEWYAQLMDMAVRDLRAEDPSDQKASQRKRLTQLAREHDNIRGALDWSLQHRETQLSLRLGAGAARFWMYHGHLSEGLDWLDRILALAGDSHPPYIDDTPFMNCVFTAGLLATSQRDMTAARRHFERILQLASVERAPKLRGGAHIQLAHMALMRGDLDGARATYAQAIEILGQDHEWMVANATCGLALVALPQGDSKSARRLFEQALAVYRSVGDERSTATTSILLGRIDVDENRLDDARARLHEALTLFRELDDPTGTLSGLVGFASLAVAERRPEQALRLLGAVETYVGRTGIGFAFRSVWMERADQAARAMLAGRSADMALSAGRNLTLNQAVAEALGMLADPSSEAGTTAYRELTRRETEVALLIARGLTNRKIAEQLVISERTVDNHVANILEKLGFSARSQIAAWTIHNGMAEAE